jgi:hypothetical protein
VKLRIETLDPNRTVLKQLVLLPSLLKLLNDKQLPKATASSIDMVLPNVLLEKMLILLPARK